MAVHRFRSIEEMGAAPTPERSVGRGLGRFFRLNAQLRALSPQSRPRGVFKFRSLEEAKKAWEKMAPRTKATFGPEG